MIWQSAKTRGTEQSSQGAPPTAMASALTLAVLFPPLQTWKKTSSGLPRLSSRPARTWTALTVRAAFGAESETAAKADPLGSSQSQ